MNDVPYLHIQFDAKEAKEFQKLLDRALNTLLPNEWPKWADELDKRVSEFVRSHSL